MRQFLTALAVLCVLGALSASAEQYVYASGGTSNIRTGPGLDYPSGRTFIVNTSASYLGETQTDERGVDWYRIEYADTVGWVSSMYTTLIGTADASTEPATGLPAWYPDMVNASVEATVYAEPNEQSDALRVFPAGMNAEYLGSVRTDTDGREWYNVSYDGVTGWVSSAYTTLILNAAMPDMDRAYTFDPAPYDEAYAYEGPEPYGGYASGSVVYASNGTSNLRSMPSLSGEILGTLHEGGSAVYLGQSSVDSRGVTWYFVSYNGLRAWVSSRYTTLY